MECEKCYYHKSDNCNPKNCPNVADTWTRINELDLKDEKTGLIIRYTMKSQKTGKIKYIYWNDLIKELWEGPEETIPDIFHRGK